MRNRSFLWPFLLFIDRRNSTNKVFLLYYKLTLKLLVLFLLVSNFEPTDIVLARRHWNMESVWWEFAETCLTGCLNVSYLWILENFMDSFSDVHIRHYRLFCWLLYLFFMRVFILKQSLQQIIGYLIQTILMIVILERHQLLWSFKLIRTKIQSDFLRFRNQILYFHWNLAYFVCVFRRKNRPLDKAINSTSLKAVIINCLKRLQCLLYRL